MVAWSGLAGLSCGGADVSEVLAGGASVGQVDGSSVSGGQVEVALAEGVDDEESAVDEGVTTSADADEFVEVGVAAL